RGLKRADRRLAPRTGSLYEHLDLLQAVLHALSRARVGGDLRGERRGFPRPLEAGRSGGLPDDHVPVLVGEGEDRGVERRLGMSRPDGDVLARTAPGATAGRLPARRCHLLRLLPAADGLLRALPGAAVRLRPLPAGGKAAPVAEAAVRADLGQALDRL